MNYLLNKIRCIVFGLTSDFTIAIPIRCIRTLFLHIFAIHDGRRVYVGKNVDLRMPWQITIGDYTVINKRAPIDWQQGLEIGCNADISQDVYIWSRYHDYHSWIGAKIVMMDSAWLCAYSNIIAQKHSKLLYKFHFNPPFYDKL